MNCRIHFLTPPPNFITIMSNKLLLLFHTFKQQENQMITVKIMHAVTLSPAKVLQEDQPES